MLAITGTPGVGKTSVAEELRKRGYRVAHVNEIAEHYGCIEESIEGIYVDMDCLMEKFRTEDWDIDFVEGHLSHYIAERCVVLRCNPVELEKRMMAKGWSREKIMENIEAEIVDYILIEALEFCHEVHEIDTTNLKVKEVADIVERVYHGKERLEAGKIDWISELGDEIDRFMRRDV